MRNRLITGILCLCCMLVLSASLMAGEYWGSKNSNKYHNPSCKWAQKIKPENKRVFKTVKEAQDAGYVACKVCKPQ